MKKSDVKLTKKDECPTVETMDNIIRLRFKSDLIELRPTAEYPIQILQAEEYELWINSIVDLKTNARITGGVDKMRRGLFGDWKDVGGGVFELRLDFGPGYRVYYTKFGKVVFILLGGGDKSSQKRDIAAALTLWGELKNEITEV